MKVVFAWELGAGFGHIACLLPLARAMQARQVKVSVISRDITAAAISFRPLGISVLQAPIALRAVGLPQQANYAETLLGAGYGDIDTLVSTIDAWRQLLFSFGTDLVVAQFAPTAILAAKSIGLPVANVGSGFEIPPHATPMQNFRDWGSLNATLLHDNEVTVTNNINAALKILGISRYENFASAINTDRTFLTTFPEFDHYPKRFEVKSFPSGNPYVGPIHEMSASITPFWRERQAGIPRLLAYLKAEYPTVDAVLEQLSQCRLNTVASVLGRGPRELSFPKASNLHVERALLDWKLGLSETDFVLCHGGIASTSTALLAGRPVILLPTNAEQFILARAVESAGLGINVAPGFNSVSVRSAVETLGVESKFRDAARAFREKYRNWNGRNSVETIVTDVLNLRS